jgi:integrase
MIAAGVDPGVKRKAEKIARADSFSAIAKEWLDLQRKKFSPATLTKAEWTFDELRNPYIGSRRIRDITPPELLVPLRKLEARGKHETARRTRQRAGQVFRYAIAPAEPSVIRRPISKAPSPRSWFVITRRSQIRRESRNCCGPFTDTEVSRQPNRP